MVEIEIPKYVSARAIPCRFIETVIEQVLGALIQGQDFSVTVNYKGRNHIVVNCEGIN